MSEQDDYVYDSDDFPDFWAEILDESFFDVLGGDLS